MDVNVKAKLLMGLDISVCDITIKNYKLGHIVEDIELDRYLRMAHISTLKPKDIVQKEVLKECKDIDMFDIFYSSENICNTFIEFFNFFTGYEWEFVHTSVFVEFHAVNEYGKHVYISRDNFNEVINVIQTMYCTDKQRMKESERDDVDDEMIELLREFEEEEEKIRKAKGATVTILSMISGIANKHPSLNLLNIWDYTVYQLAHTYHRLNRIDNENRVFAAVYAGNIDSKKAELDRIHWANDAD